MLGAAWKHGLSGYQHHSTALDAPFATAASKLGVLNTSLPEMNPLAFELDEELGWSDACANACSQATDPEDARVLLSHADLDLDVATVCIVRCRNRAKSENERGFVAQASGKPSKVRTYLL